MFVFLWLHSLNVIISLSIHVAANGIVSSCLWLRNIPWYLIFFVHSSEDEHLGCFNVLTIVNSAARNMGMHASFLIIVLSGYMPRIAAAGSQGNSALCFKGTSTLFSTVPAAIHTPANGVGGYPSPTPSPAFAVCRLFDDGHADWCEWSWLPFL